MEIYEPVQRVIKHLTQLCKDISKSNYGNIQELLDMAQGVKNPPYITELADAFGVMLVKVEAREYYLKNLVTQLRDINKEGSDDNARVEVEPANNQFLTNKFIGKSPHIREIMGLVDKLANTSVNVLITGESGTGKELVAKSLHFKSNRQQKPFVALNCTAIPESLFESELFGIERGVASGVTKRKGKIEQANGGSIFLDEIGDMSLASQAKILRSIEEREVTRLGGINPIPVDIRIISATNKDLKREVEQGRFRQDLYFRLRVGQICLPPLREHPEDIPLLLNYFLKLYAIQMNHPTIKLSKEAFNVLSNYTWPGNVRELKNEMERIVALANSELIGINDLSDEILNRNSNVFYCSETKSIETRRIKNEINKHAYTIEPPEFVPTDTNTSAIFLNKGNDMESSQLRDMRDTGNLSMIEPDYMECNCVKRINRNNGNIIIEGLNVNGINVNAISINSMERMNRTSCMNDVSLDVDNLEALEKAHIQVVLQRVMNNKAEAARRLGISREGLRKKLNRYRLATAD